MRISRCTDAFCACRLLQTGVRGANAIRRGNEGTGTKDLFIRKPDSKNNNTVLGQKTGWPFLICDCHNQILLKTQKDTKKEQHTTDFLACSLQVWIKALEFRGRPCVSVSKVWRIYALSSNSLQSHNCGWTFMMWMDCFTAPKSIYVQWIEKKKKLPKDSFCLCPFMFLETSESKLKTKTKFANTDWQF